MSLGEQIFVKDLAGERIRSLQRKIAFLKESQLKREKEIADKKREVNDLRRAQAPQNIVQDAIHSYTVAIQLKRLQACEIVDLEKELKTITEPLKKIQEAKAKREAEQKRQNELSRQFAPLINILAKPPSTGEDVEAILEAVQRVEQLSPELVDAFSHSAMVYGGMKLPIYALDRVEELLPRIQDKALRHKARRIINKKLTKTE